MKRSELEALNPKLPATFALGDRVLVPDPETAADLKGFGSRDWLAGLLDPNRIGSPHYFGSTKLNDGKMRKFVTEKVARYTPELRASLTQVIAALSAEAGLKSQQALDTADGMHLEEGRRLLREDHRCTDCHQFRQADEDATAPDLTGWGSREWLVSFIGNPAQPRFYGKRNDRMPRFKDDGVLDDRSIGLLADWLRGEWYEPAR
jgi:ubiquinol-cytochrome c reductase cytochrome b subunit